MKSYNFMVIVYQEDYMYIAECSEIGTVDQGETIEKAIAGLKEATRLYLEEFNPPDTSFVDDDFAAISEQTSAKLVTNIEVSYA